MFGTELEFSRNWVSNLNDDAIFAETEEITDLRIAGNVIEQSLTAINFARKVAGNSVFVYRNLIDLRRPTASVRPQPQPHGGTQPLELGHLFKGDFPRWPARLVPQHDPGQRPGRALLLRILPQLRRRVAPTRLQQHLRGHRRDSRCPRADQLATQADLARRHRRQLLPQDQSLQRRAAAPPAGIQPR